MAIPLEVRPEKYPLRVFGSKWSFMYCIRDVIIHTGLNIPSRRMQSCTVVHFALLSLNMIQLSMPRDSPTGKTQWKPIRYLTQDFLFNLVFVKMFYSNRTFPIVGK